MKYGMNMLLWTTEVTEEHYPILDNLKSMGYDGVELPVFDMDINKFTALGKQLDSVGLERTAVTICTGDANPISDSANIREAGLNRLKQAIDACAAAGVTHLCGPIHSAIGEFSGSGATGDEWKYGQETLAKAADHAQAAEVTLVVEYLNRFECYFLNCAADASRFVAEVGHPYLKTMYDTFHANIEEKDIAEAIRACADQTVHVHISENDRSTPGEGHVDWDTTFNTLKETEYDGWMVVEAFGLSLPDLAAATKIWRRMYTDEETLARNALAFMKSRTAG
ncbi:MAG: sugar phosphate isomerase/epimerase [Planctomycetaceae bacterium]|jgi:D-psicose/D-tagatose/L-ribulose 3-epimerase|nr:sugar phosphate isomerase/epimerase [Planctomycetaceae bacterium]MBT6155693.1 sugar phosphate isomerase/epimerase [Planctomycetaceae bacterium]MBT6486329.1 sugar phosphate isomerase/epimerase [Planctomycetaceae bacterium]MBT6497538.1 sugar phosphate isomerase/epimerase [Planctomycetaceae bacterium]